MNKIQACQKIKKKCTSQIKFFPSLTVSLSFINLRVVLVLCNLGVNSAYSRKPLMSITNHSLAAESPSPDLVVKKSDAKITRNSSARNPSSKDDLFDKLYSSIEKRAESENIGKLLSSGSCNGNQQAHSNFSFSSPEESEISPCLGLFTSFSKPANVTPKLKPKKSRKCTKAKNSLAQLKVKERTNVLSETLGVEIELEKPPSYVPEPSSSVSPVVRPLVSTLSVATSTPVLKHSPRVLGMYD